MLGQKQVCRLLGQYDLALGTGPKRSDSPAQRKGPWTRSQESFSGVTSSCVTSGHQLPSVGLNFLTSKMRVWDRWSPGSFIVNIHESPKKQWTQTKSMFWFHFLSVLFHFSRLWRLYFNGVTRHYLLWKLFVVTRPKELKEEVLERGRG